MTSTLALQRRLRSLAKTFGPALNPGPLDGRLGPSTLRGINAALDMLPVKLPPAPPSEFDHEPKFDYQVLTVSPELVRQYCGGIENACAIPKRRVIVISDKLKGSTRQAFLRHEKGHINGWLDCRETVVDDDHDHEAGA